MATLTVGRGQQYATVSQAIAASRDGDVLQVQAGTYTNDFATITTDITLKAVGGMAHMKATTPPGNGKAIFVTRGDITIEGFEFSGVKVRDGNGAGIRHEDGALTIRGSHFHHNQDGILTIGRNAEATLTIHDSEFNNNGIGDGRTHNLYVGKIGRLEVDNSYFHTVPVGHLLKSRAEETVITNSRFFDHGSSASYEIDLPNGGDAVLRGNVIQQGPNSQNANIVAFGAEGNLHPGSSIEMTDNIVINQRAAGGTMLWNKAGAPATLADNDVFGVAEGRVLSGPGNVSGTEFLRAAPRLDTSSPWEGGGRPTPPPAQNPDPPPPQQPEPPPSQNPEPPPSEPGASDAARIWGTGGDDLLLGGAGRSQLIGREGDDTLDGGQGDDGLIGGPGADVFRFGTDFGNDGIRTFEHGADRIDVSALDIAEAQFAAAVDIAQRGANVIITVEDHGTIKVYGADAAQFGSGDFILG